MMSLRRFFTNVLIFAFFGIISTTCSNDNKSGTGPDAQGVRITVTDGGTATSPDGLLTLTIPAGALKEDTNISIEVVPESDYPEQFAELPPTGAVYNLQPDGLEFNYPVELNIDMPANEVNDIKTVDGYPSIGGVLLSSDGVVTSTDNSIVIYDVQTGTANFLDYIDHFSFFQKTVPLWVTNWDYELNAYQNEVVGEAYFDSDLGPSESDIGIEQRVTYSIKNRRSELTFYTDVSTYWSKPDNVPLIWYEVDYPGLGHQLNPHASLIDVEHPYKWVCKESGDGWVQLEFLFEDFRMNSFYNPRRVLFTNNISCLESSDGDDGDGGGVDLREPEITGQCAGVTHYDGESVITMCVKFDHVPDGEGWTTAFQISGEGIEDHITVQNYNGQACAEATIYSYGTYNWTAYVNGPGGETIVTGTITVGSGNQPCGY